jgi:uncharacterized phage protein (TIGR02220 family)
MASVRIENKAFTDVRIDVLAQLAGYANRHEAIGRLAYLWSVCTEQNSYVVNEAVVIATLGARGVEALVKSGLGRRTKKGVYVCGTRGRIEWLEEKRKCGRLGGRPKGTGRKPNGSPSGLPTGDPNVNPPSPSPSPDASKEEDSAGKPADSSSSSKKEDVEQVVAHYLKTFPKWERSAKSKKTIRLIKARLEEGYSPEDLCQAIDGNAASHWHRDKRQTSLELVVRDATHVDQAIARAEAAQPAVTRGCNPLKRDDDAPYLGAGGPAGRKRLDLDGDDLPQPPAVVEAGRKP